MFVWIKQAAGLRQSVLAAALLSLPLLVGHTTRAQAQPTLSISAPADAKEGDWATRDPSFKVRVSEVIWWSNIEFKVCFSGTATRDTTAAATIPASADYQLVDATGRKRLQAPQPGYFWPIPQTSSCVTDVIWAGGLDKIVEIWIKGDTEIEPDETVVATLSLIGTPPAGVTLGTSTATHTIKNDDHATGKLPQVSIHRTHRLIGQIVSWCPPMFEGADTIFTLIANPAPSSPITVTVDVTDSRDFATDGQTGSRTVTLGTDGTGSLTVTTVNDNTDEPEGYISATVQAGSDYTVGSPSSASTWMCDNDLSAEQEQESQETLCATPALLLTSAVGSTEGAPLAFTLAALRAPVPQMSVTLSVAQVGDYIGPAELGRRTVTVPTSGSVTVSIPTVDDIVGEPDGTVTVTLKAGSGYTLSAPSSLTADVVDNDTPGVTIRETDKSTTVSEAAGAGNTDTYTVVLDSRPTHSVSITVTSEETAAATVSPSTLTFKPSAWNTAQMVTVTGGDDNVDQGDSRSVTIRHSATSTDSKYNGISIAPVSATVVDDDTAGVTIRETDNSTTVSEAAGAGSIDTYTVVLDTPPSDTVTVTVTAGTGVRVSRSIGTADSSQTLTFTTSTWNVPQAVTVRGVDDAIDNPNDKRTVTINHAADSNDPNYRIPNAGTVRVTVEDDNDTAGVTIRETDKSTTVSEAAGAGNTDTYTVVLDSRPTHEVSITVTSEETAAATVSPSTLTFKPSAWNTAQKVTVTGVDDSMDQNGNRSATIRHSATSTDPRYNDNNISISDVTATVVDDDTAGVTIRETDKSTTVSEAAGAGNIDTYTVVLESEPTHEVSITVTSGDAGAATVSPSTLTFKPSAWNTARMVTVTGVDDDVDQNGNRSATIRHSATSDDGNYDNISIGDVTATVVDDDGAGVSISETSATVSEAAGAGNTDTYTVVLDTLPSDTVTVTVTAGTGVRVSQSGGTADSSQTLTFTPGDWNTAQTVTVRGEDDAIDNPNDERTVTINHAADSNDPNYRIPNAGTVRVTVEDDNDTAGVTIIQSNKSTTVSEAAGAGNTDTYTVVLDSRPTHEVRITVISEETAAATVSPSTLTFKPSAWNTAQMVTVTGGDDNVDQGDSRSVTIRHSATSTDSKYNGISISPVSVTVVDDDGAGVSISSSSLTVSEAAGDGNSASYRVVLESEPTHEVSIRVTSGDPAAARVSPSSLRFSRSTWNTAQKVTVTGVDDDVEQNGNRSATIRHRATSTDPKYNGNNISISDVTATVEDDGGGVEDADGGPSQPVEDEGGAIVLTFPPYEGRWFYTEGVAIPSLVLPAATGGRGGVSYALTPALPAGLRLESGGIVRGTPTEVQQARSYTWRATDADGNEAALVFSITVAEDPRRRQGRGEAKRLLAALGREALAVSLDTIGARLGAVSGGGLTLAGQPVWLEGGAATAVGAGGAAWRPGADGELLSTSAFSLPLAAGERGSNGGAEGERPLWAVWGRGDLAGFAGAGAMAYDGWLRSGFLGLDRRAGAWVGGLALSHEQGQADYSGVGDGRLETSLTALYPYGRWRLEEGLEVQGVVGAGWGEARRQPEGGAEERGRLSMQMAALGVSQALPPVAGLALSLRADGAVTAMETDSGPSAVHGLRANSWRLRAGLEASGRFQLDGAGWLEPFLEGAVRQDGGDGLVGSGVELAGGLRYEAPGVAVELRGRWLAVHSAEDAREEGVALTVRAGPGADGSGLFVALSPQWGAATGGVAALWGQGWPRLATATSGAVAAQVGYGLPLSGGGLLTPFAEAGLVDGAGWRMRLATRLSSHRGGAVTVAGERQGGGGRPAAQALLLDFQHHF